MTCLTVLKEKLYISGVRYIVQSHCKHFNLRTWIFDKSLLTSCPNLKPSFTHQLSSRDTELRDVTSHSFTPLLLSQDPWGKSKEGETKKVKHVSFPMNEGFSLL